MPKVLLPIHGIKESVTRPVVTDIIHELITLTGLPKNIKFQLPGDTEKMHQPGSSIDPQEKYGYYDETTRLFITYREEPEDELINTMSVFKPDYPHFFFDKTTRTFMRAGYSRNKITISVRYQATDKGAANKWRDEIRTRVAHGRTDAHHNIQYSYHIPEEYIYILKEIHRLRENVSGYGQDFETYLSENITKKSTIVTDQAAKNKKWVIRESQARINGYFDFDFFPEEGSRANDGTSWNIQFDYVIRLDVPIVAEMMYELVIHNQELGDAYRDSSTPEKLDNYLVSYSQSNMLYDAWDNRHRLKDISETGFKYPDYDDFVPSSIFPHTLRLFTGLVTLDLNDGVSLLNLKQLGPYTLANSVIRYLERNYQYVNAHGKTLINVAVYDFEDPISSSLFYVDSDLNVKLSNPSINNTRKLFHVRVSVYTNPLTLPARAIDDLCDDYDGTLEIMSFVSPTCILSNPLEKIGINMVSKNSLMDFMRCRYRKAMELKSSDDPACYMTAISLVVVAHRQD